MFLRNSWYVAAWSRDIGRKLSTRTILNENIVMYRQQGGAVAALEDACPHRKVPMSMGQLRTITQIFFAP